MKKSVGKFALRKHKEVEQALRFSLCNLFEQLAWRICQLRCVHKVALTIPQTLVPANMHLVRYIGD